MYIYIMCIYYVHLHDVSGISDGAHERASERLITYLHQGADDHVHQDQLQVGLPDLRLDACPCKRSQSVSHSVREAVACEGSISFVTPLPAR